MEPESFNNLTAQALAGLVMREIYGSDADPPGPLPSVARNDASDENREPWPYSSMWAFNTLQRVMATYRRHAKQRRLPPLREAYSDRVLYEDEPLIPIFEGKHSDGQLRCALIVWRRLIATGPVRLAKASRHRR